MGDSACWLDRVCLECGLFIDDEDVEDNRCPHCAAPLPQDGGEPA
ncbi:MAG TPA: hypothetical protein VK088_02430 [Acidimicrobiia bacterium]|nr:hypothetical protein [Acidimicrobiia bacterium]